MGPPHALSEAAVRMTVMTDGTTWLADRQSIAFGGYHVVLTRGLSPQELAKRLAATLLYDTEHVVVPVADHTGTSLLDGYEKVEGDPATGARLQERLTAAGIPDPGFVVGRAARASP